MAEPNSEVTKKLQTAVENYQKIAGLKIDEEMKAFLAEKFKQFELESKAINPDHVLTPGQKFDYIKALLQSLEKKGSE